MMNYEFEMAWASIYHTFDDAFDYRGKPFEIGGALVMWDGSKMVEYWEAPF